MVFFGKKASAKNGPSHIDSIISADPNEMRNLDRQMSNITVDMPEGAAAPKQLQRPQPMASQSNGKRTYKHSASDPYPIANSKVNAGFNKERNKASLAKTVARVNALNAMGIWNQQAPSNNPVAMYSKTSGVRSSRPVITTKAKSEKNATTHHHDVQSDAHSVHSAKTNKIRNSAAVAKWKAAYNKPSDAATEINPSMKSPPPSNQQEFFPPVKEGASSAAAIHSKYDSKYDEMRRLKKIADRPVDPSTGETRRYEAMLHRNSTKGGGPPQQRQPKRMPPPPKRTDAVPSKQQGRAKASPAACRRVTPKQPQTAAARQQQRPMRRGKTF